ncbi:MAG: histidine kinase [Christensenellaceae bacterium]
MQKIRHIPQRINGSIQSKICISFFVVMILCLSTVFVNSNNSAQVIDAHRDILQISMIYNDFFVNFEKTSTALNKSTDSVDAVNTYIETYPQLLETANEICLKLSAGGYDRNLVDLKYMVQTYCERGTIVINDLRNRDYSQAVEDMAQARKVQTLIGEQYNRVYKTVLNRSVQMRQAADRIQKQNQIINWFIFIGCVISCALLIRLLSVSIAKPVKALSRAATAFSPNGLESDMSEVKNIVSEDEIGKLATAFLQMQYKIQSQFEIIKMNTQLQSDLLEEEMKVLRAEKLRKESELKALQSRINPHFMFNSLNMISQMAYMEQASQTAELMESLGDFLRYNLDQFSKTVTIEQEMGNIQDYITIQKKRFGQRIQFELKCQQEAMDGHLPCLILQPLVENAIIHGVGMYLANGLVGVSIYRVQKTLHIKVYDNGEGMDSSTIEQLHSLAQENIAEDDSSSIGVRNVFNRLKLFFDGKVEIRITSNPHEYTEIWLIIPYQNDCTK